MPRGFTKKDERQVLAIKKSCRARGGSKADCDRIAFATVNKRRRAEGRTLSGSDALTQRQILLLDDLGVFGLDQERQDKLAKGMIITGAAPMVFSMSDLVRPLGVPRAVTDASRPLFIPGAVLATTGAVLHSKQGAFRFVGYAAGALAVAMLVAIAGAFGEVDGLAEISEDPDIIPQ